jgi:alpha-mannosidase
LEVNEIRSQDKAVNRPRPLQSAAGSFLKVDQPNLVLVTWKGAEDEMGTVLRFVEVGGMSGTATISTPLITAERAWLCNAVEENETPLEASSQGVTFPFRPHQIITIRLQGEPLLLPN